MNDTLDKNTQFTAGDAMTCKYSALSKGYFTDPYLRAFVEQDQTAMNNDDGSSSRSTKITITPPKKPPIINRGYYARIHTMNETITRFLNVVDAASISTSSAFSATTSTIHPSKQVVILGSGFDTLSLRLIQDQNANMIVFEIEFPDIIHKKIDLCLSIPSIRSTLLSGSGDGDGDGDGDGPISSAMEKNNDGNEGGNHRTKASAFRPSLPSFEEEDMGETVWKNTVEHTATKSIDVVAPPIRSFGRLHFIAEDLRNTSGVLAHLKTCGLDPNIPTLILTECVLVYIDQPQADALIQALAAHVHQACWISYDMIHPLDVFGKTMQQNLRNAQFHIPGFTDYPTLEAHKRRYLDGHFASSIDHVTSETMLTMYDRYIESEELKRIATLEIFDELEEWRMLMDHYSFTVAVHGEMLKGVLPTALR